MSDCLYLALHCTDNTPQYRATLRLDLKNKQERLEQIKSNINPITVWSFSNCISFLSSSSSSRSTDVQNKCRACHSQLGRTQWVLMGPEQQDACTQIRSAAIYKLGHGLWTTAEFITASSLRNPATSVSNTLLWTPTSALSERSLPDTTLICSD